MRGAIAVGHPPTAEAAARSLPEGVNAVEACVAAAAVSWVCESPLTGRLAVPGDPRRGGAGPGAS